MNEKEQKLVLDRLSVLKGQRLAQVSRAGSMIDLGFGELIKSKSACKAAGGGFEIKEILRSRYALQISCGFRFTCGDKIFL